MALGPLHHGDPQRIGGYQLVGRLGAGGMGVVYLAHAADGSLVALKRLRSELADDPSFLTRFRREASTLTKVTSAFTARVLAVHTDETPPYLVLDHVPGPSLAEQVAKAGPLPPGAVHGLAAGLSAALLSIHSAGIVHRDLKPANVLLADDGPRVIDFGIAHLSDATHLTRTGAYIGSPGFMAPEQFTGEAGPPADVFAWALAVAFAATGRAPFGVGPSEAIFYRVLHSAPDLAGVPDHLLPLLSAALSKNPAERPTAPQLVAALTGGTSTAEHADTLAAEVLARTRTQTRIAGERPRTNRRLKRSLSLAVALCSVAALVIGVAYTGNWFHQRRQDDTTTSAVAAAATTTTATAPPTTSPQQPAAATRVLTYQPWTPQGLSSRVKATQASGSCWSGASKAPRSEAFRCIADGGLIHDPCFSSPFQMRQVACPVLSPDEVVVITLTQSLPANSGIGSGGLQSWLMVLSTGEQCGAAGGATTTFEGHRLNYGCANGAVYGDLNTSQPLWTAHYQAKDSAYLETVTIATIYR